MIHPKDRVRTHPATRIGIASYQASEDLTGQEDKRAEILKVKYLYIKVRSIAVFTVLIFSRISLILDLVLHFCI